MSQWHLIEGRVNDFVKKNPKFKTICAECFSQADVDSDGLLSTFEASACAEVAFEQLQQSLDEYALKLQKPTAEEVLQFFKATDMNQDQRLNQGEFEEFLIKLIKLLVLRFTISFGKKYGVGMLTGIAAVFLIKRALRGIPFVGLVSALFPTILVGPVLGVAAVYSYDQKDILAVKKKLFPPKPNQFRTSG